MIDELNVVIEDLKLIPATRFRHIKDLVADRAMQHLIRIKKQYELELEQEVIDSPGWNETGK